MISYNLWSLGLDFVHLWHHDMHLSSFQKLLFNCINLSQCVYKCNGLCLIVMYAFTVLPSSYNTMDYEENSIEGTPAYVEPITLISNGDSGNIAISPLCDHYNDQMRIDSHTTCSDEEIIESLYQNLFSFVLCLQIEESGCGSHTPLSTPCPGAPMKLTKLSRNIDPGFQRKLF